MTYIQRVPGGALRPFVRRLWYCRAPRLVHAHERVLPNGCMQAIFNLANNSLTECDGLAGPLPGAIVVGARGRFETIATADMQELAGVVIEPGGFAALFGERADLFFEQSIGFDCVWPVFDVARMQEAREPALKLAVLETLLGQHVRANMARSSLVDGALLFLQQESASVAACARSAGVSERWLSRTFREQVGLSPKLWMRVERFQLALRHLHRGADLPWAELALQCGYYDQAHFIHDFHAFSGINPTTYTAARGPWPNHVPLA